jgi:sugar lactone lactonase YvrE
LVKTSGEIVVCSNSGACAKPSSRSLASELGQLNQPLQAISDSSGNIYISDHSNNRIVTYVNASSPYWADFGKNSSFSNPMGLAFGPAGGVIVADFGNSRVQWCSGSVSSGTCNSWSASPSNPWWSPTTSGPISLLWDGTYLDVMDDSYSFYQYDLRTSDKTMSYWAAADAAPGALALKGVFASFTIDNASNFYLNHPGTNEVIQWIQGADSETGQLTLSSASEAPPSSLSIQGAQGLAHYNDGRSEWLFVSDTLHDRILKCTLDMTACSVFAGTRGSDFGELYQPKGLWLDTSGNLYVSDTGNHRIQKFNSNGKAQRN